MIENEPLRDVIKKEVEWMSTINKVKKEAGVMSRQQADRSSLWMLGQIGVNLRSMDW